VAHEVFGILAFVFGLAAYVPYNIALWRNTVRPRIASWIIWASLDWTSFAGMLVKEEMNGVVIAFCFGATFTLIHGLFRTTALTFGWIDKLCLGIGFASIILWLIDGDPTRAIVIMGVGLFAGTTPTILHVWDHPHDENFPAWSLYGLSVTCGLFAVSEWTIAKSATPVVFAICDFLVLCCMIRGLLQKRDPIPQS
jgi:hypothetical protein